jgi:hypothetical protein
VGVFLFTDFGSNDLYVGQVKAAVLRHAADATIIDMLHEAPTFNIKAGAHLLAALASHLPEGSVTLAVVDPGVGGKRAPVALHADRRWYVGPDNGLLSVVAVRAREAVVYPIVWRPKTSSNSFHGRDLFAPAAGQLASGQMNVLGAAHELAVQFSGDDLAEIIYIDHYGNAMTGLLGGALPKSSQLAVSGHRLGYSRVFVEAETNAAFWYENSIGLVEIAVNQASAVQRLELSIGDPVGIEQ